MRDLAPHLPLKQRRLRLAEFDVFKFLLLVSIYQHHYVHQRLRHY